MADRFELVEAEAGSSLDRLRKELLEASEPDPENSLDLIDSFPPPIVNQVIGKLMQRNYQRSIFQSCLLVQLIDQQGLDLWEVLFMPRAGIHRLVSTLPKDSTQLRLKHTAVEDFLFNRRHIHELLCWLQLLLNLLWLEDEGNDFEVIHKKFFSPLQKNGLHLETVEQITASLNAVINKVINAFILPHHTVRKAEILRDFVQKKSDGMVHADQITHQLIFKFWYQNKQKDPSDEILFKNYSLTCRAFLDWQGLLENASQFSQARPNQPLSLSGLGNIETDSNTEFDLSNEAADSLLAHVGDEESEQPSGFAAFNLPPLNDIKFIAQDDLKRLRLFEQLNLLSAPPTQDQCRGVLRYISLEKAQNSLTQAERNVTLGKLSIAEFEAMRTQPPLLAYKDGLDELMNVIAKLRRIAREIVGILLHHDQFHAAFLLPFILPPNFLTQIQPLFKEFSPPALIRQLRDKTIAGELVVAQLEAIIKDAMKVTRKGFRGEFGLDAFIEASLVLQPLLPAINGLEVALKAAEPNCVEWDTMDRSLILPRILALYPSKG